MSPLVHNAAFAHEKLNKVYLPFRVPKDSLAETLREFDWLGVKGYSVTLPHKEAVLECAKVCDPPVREIGAANTLYRGADGAWHAANTDYDAALGSLLAALPPRTAESRLEGEAETEVDAAHPLAGRRVLLLGAGGVARAIGLGVLKSGGALLVSNRTKARAEELVKQFNCLLVQWENRGTPFADVVVNCTSVGMHPKVDESPFADNWLREGTVVFDTIYNPERTLLIKHGRERGCVTVTGVEMFVRQAARQFELFTGRPAPLEVMRAALRHAISAARTS
jgi:3-dehydroquinate dehydratase/shikimate dehydrogenase